MSTYLESEIPKYETKAVVESRVLDASEFEVSPSLPLWMGPLLACIALGSILYFFVRVPRILADVFKLYEEDELKSQSFSKPLFFELTPCKRCRYYNNSLYLRCAVHPSKALTEHAIDCSDYCPTSEHAV